MKPILSAIAIFLCLATPLSAANFLRSAHGQIVDSAGREIILKGFGLGGWLEPEGYMIQIEQNVPVDENGTYGDYPLSPSEIEAAIADLIGADDTKEFFRIWESTHVMENDIAQIAAWGGNSVRLSFNAKRLLPRVTQPSTPPYIIDERGFDILDSCISWCKKNGMWVILDMHCVPGGQTDDHIADPVVKNHALLWEDTATYFPQTVELWRLIASRYVNETAVAGYDILNEPGLSDYDAADTLRSRLVILHKAITQAIRSIDTNHLLFIEGLRWANDFEGLTPPWDSSMVYTFHKYWDTNDLASIQPFLDLRDTYGVPIFNGETGENSPAWGKGMADLLAEHKIGWSWWTLKKLDDAETQPWNCPMSSGYESVMKYWAKSGPRPTAADAKAALFDLAESFDVSRGKCTLVPEMLTAVGFDPSGVVSTVSPSQPMAKQHPQFYNTPGGFTIVSMPFYGKATLTMASMSGRTILHMPVTIAKDGNVAVLLTERKSIAPGVYCIHIDGANRSNTLDMTCRF